MYTASQQKETATIADFSSTGDKVTFTPAFPSEIVEIGFIVTTVLVASAGLVMKADKRITAGSDTGRTDGTVGTLTLTAAQCNALTAGKVARSRLPFSDSSAAPQATPQSPQIIKPGQQCILELTTGITSGAGIGFIIFRERPAYLDGVETVVTA